MTQQHPHHPHLCRDETIKQLMLLLERETTLFQLRMKAKYNKN